LEIDCSIASNCKVVNHERTSNERLSTPQLTRVMNSTVGL
jgi:hypothetical protein